MVLSNNLILLTKEEKLSGIVAQLLGSGYNLITQQFNLTNLMVSLYKYDPLMILVDYDEYSVDIFSLLNTMLNDNYTPVLALHSLNHTPPLEESVSMEYFLNKNEMASSLAGMVKIFSDFKKKYSKIKESYSLNNIINSNIDKYLKKYVSNDFLYADSLEEVLLSIFTQNDHMINKPSIILLAHRTEEITLIEIYNVAKDTVSKDPRPIILRKQSYAYGVNSEFENAFYRNYNEEEYSDIGSSTAFFDEEILNRIRFIKNFTGYITTDTAIIAMNYEDEVSHFEAAVIKEMCINYNLIQNIFNQINKVNSAFIYTVNALSRASEANDDDTGNHIRRVNEYSRLIAENLGLDKKFIETIHFSAQMHDVGKISVPNQILTKPARLTDDEFEIMKKHTVFGAKIVGDSPQLKMAAEIALSHHEKYDGSGYPNRFAGEQIPLSGRIVAIADVFDALRTQRVYKQAFDHERTYKIITEGDGRVMPQHFDPHILEIFRKRHDEFEEIYQSMA